jgi:hypothetical protein
MQGAWRTKGKRRRSSAGESSQGSHQKVSRASATMTPSPAPTATCVVVWPSVSLSGRVSRIGCSGGNS